MPNRPRLSPLISNARSRLREPHVDVQKSYLHELGLESRCSTCLGLKRIQFSAFFGKLNRNRRQELALRLQDELGDEPARIRIVPVCEQDLKDMWVLDQYHPRGGESEAKGLEERPRLRVLGSEE